MRNTEYLLVEKDKIIEHEKTVKNINFLIEQIYLDKKIKEPIRCICYKNNYLILDGHHRYQALKMMNYQLIPIKTYHLSDIRIDHWYHIISESDYKSIGKMCSKKNRCPTDSLIFSFGIGENKFEFFDKEELFFFITENVFNIYSDKKFDITDFPSHDQFWIRYSGITFHKIFELTRLNKTFPVCSTKFEKIEKGREEHIDLTLLL